MTKNITQSYAILQFLRNLRPAFVLPDGVQMMNPFADPEADQLAGLFYQKFYHDTHPRRFIFGINPGRFGGGITGVPFTDPVKLEKVCGIPNSLPKKEELSAQFVYAVVEAYGGAAAFYKDFFITAMSPLGFTKNGVNLNYYDDKALLKAIEPFMIQCILDQQAQILTEKNSCYCLGEGTNFKIFQRLNEQHHFYKKIIPLPHPRWVMQYRRKKVDEYVQVYVEALRSQP